MLSVRIDRKRKQPATLLLRALGLAETREEIIELLGNDEMVLRTLDRDPATTKEESLIELYKRFRPGEPPTIDSARTLLEGLFFNPQRYDLAKVGRYKINKKLGFDPDFEASTLTDEDITKTMQYIVALHAGEEGVTTDDIDHFGNRRIRTVGELIQNQFRIGLSPHGARGARAHEHAGARRDHAAVPGEHPPHRGGHQGVLRKLRSCPSSWTRRTPPPASRTSAACRPWARAACPASAPASRCATCTPPTTAACAPSRRLKARTSASSARWPPTPA